jgi:hypothetical protein
MFLKTCSAGRVSCAEATVAASASDAITVVNKNRKRFMMPFDARSRAL